MITGPNYLTARTIATVLYQNDDEFSYCPLALLHGTYVIVCSDIRSLKHYQL